MEITRLVPVFKDYIWGGKKLKEKLNKDSGFERTAESWEVSCHTDGLCLVADGRYKSKTLFESLINEGFSASGFNIETPEDFPVLLKFIDAESDLSIQVHPERDLQKGITGKTEFWYIVEADEGAEIALGLKEAVSKDKLKKLCADGEITDYLNYIKVKPGDFFLVRAGMVHSIGKGILLAEVQQNSNETYRLYDFGRSRPLHLDRGAEAFSSFENLSECKQELTLSVDSFRNTICSCEYFKVDQISVDGEIVLDSNGKFSIAAVICGCGMIGSLSVIFGDSVFIPADKKNIVVSGNFTFLFIYF